MVLLQGKALRDRDAGDPLAVGGVVHLPLRVDAHRRSALVQDRELWVVVVHPRHAHALLLPKAQHVFPVHLRIPTTLLLVPLDQVVDPNDLELLPHPLFLRLGPLRLRNPDRVGDLIRQGAVRHVNPLGHEKDPLERGPIAGAWPEQLGRSRASTTAIGGIERPEAPKDPKERGLSAGIRPSHHERPLRSHRKVQVRGKAEPLRCDEVHVGEADLGF